MAKGLAGACVEHEMEIMGENVAEAAALQRVIAQGRAQGYR